MKDEFPGYFPPSAAATKAAWKDGLFSFDASVLLALYEYSDETRQELLKLLRSLGDRLWITHRAALEFLNGRLGVISSQAKKYEDSISALNAIESVFKSARGHPFLSKPLASEAEAFFEKLRAFLTAKRSEVDCLISKDDPIQEEVATLLKGRIGPDFSKERLEEIFVEGETRYAKNIPPGYEDAKKPDSIQRYGDLTIWFQLVEKAQEAKRAITFVTADGKEDWWRISKGKTIGPRPELVAEWHAKAGVAFQMFSPERFMVIAGEKLSHTVKKTAIKEVKEVRKASLSFGALRRLEALTTDPWQGENPALALYQNALNEQQNLNNLLHPGNSLQGLTDQLQKQQTSLNNLLHPGNSLQGLTDQLQKQQTSLNNLLNPGNSLQGLTDQLQKQQTSLNNLLHPGNSLQGLTDQLQKQQTGLNNLSHPASLRTDALDSPEFPPDKKRVD